MSSKIKKIYKFLYDNYPLPKKLPSSDKIHTLDNIFDLKLSHFGVGNNYGYFNKNLCSKKYKKTKGQNYFRISDFTINDNWKNLKSVIERLYKVRDKYKTLYFDVDNNSGGDMIPCHIILYCLCGGKQKWMKEYRTIDKDNKNIWKNEWNPWTPWEKQKYDIGQHDQFLQLKLNVKNFDKYTKPYDGKIIVYSNSESTSSTWYFITYLIYVFADHIKRYVKDGVKIGKVSGKLKIRGCTGTQSGDGNPKKKSIDNVIIKVPTQETISRPIMKKDYLRYWM